MSKKKGIFYKMVDEYSLFYFSWIEPNKEAILDKGMPKGYLIKIQQSSALHAWAGYSFETICYKHIPLKDIYTFKVTS